MTIQTGIDKKKFENYFCSFSYGNTTGFGFLYSQAYLISNVYAGSDSGLKHAKARGLYNNYMYSYVVGVSYPVDVFLTEGKIKSGKPYFLSGHGNLAFDILLSEDDKSFYSKDSSYTKDTFQAVELVEYKENIKYIIFEKRGFILAKSNKNNDIYIFSEQKLLIGPNKTYSRDFITNKNILLEDLVDFSFYILTDAKLLTEVTTSISQYVTPSVFIEKDSVFNLKNYTQLSIDTIRSTEGIVLNLPLGSKFESIKEAAASILKNNILTIGTNRDGKTILKDCCDWIKNTGHFTLYLPEYLLLGPGYTEEFLLEYIELINVMMGKKCVTVTKTLPPIINELSKYSKEGYSITIDTTTDLSYFLLIIVRYFWMRKYYKIPNEAVKIYKETGNFFQALISASITFSDDLNFSFVHSDTDYKTVKDVTIEDYLTRLQKKPFPSRFDRLLHPNNIHQFLK